MDLFAYTKVTATHATGIPRAKEKKPQRLCNTGSTFSKSME